MGDSAGAFAFWLAMGGVGAAVILGPIGHAFGRWIEAMANRSRPAVDLEMLDVQREQMEHLAARVNELEERLDFTERLLAQQRESERIGKGSV